MSNNSSSTVWVIVDAEFGERLADLPIEEAVWVIESPENSAVAQRLWSKCSGETRLSGITAFKADSAATPEEVLLDNLATIDLHHGEYSSKPPYLRIHVCGACLTPSLEQALSEFGFNRHTQMSNGFVAEKSPTSPKLA